MIVNKKKISLKDTKGLTLVALHGTGTHGGKSRIVNAFQAGLSMKEKADFVKKNCENYGFGSPIRKRGYLHHVSFFKGIKYSYCDLSGVSHVDCTSTWKELAVEIERLIRVGRYMSLRELAEHELTHGGGGQVIDEKVQESNT